MNTLQKLIDMKVKEGKSLRRLADEIGVDYKSIRNYREGTEPRGKNLARLADYFNVHFADLLDDYVPGVERLSPIKKEMLEVLASATDDVGQRKKKKPRFLRAFRLAPTVAGCSNGGGGGVR